ncbi:GNAT family N-acetyltransferase [Candidatus Lokiarchaeum ossiferum]|uniref:GNAT family N-acetyltransferase n=1 Tax=Candidatus Lokiarchaeum ossiferum TaxID=2951803 RepID=UPI00352C0762
MENAEDFGFITGQKVNLVPLNSNHVDLYFKWNNDSRVRKYLGNVIPIPLEEIKKSIGSPKTNYVGFEVWHKADKKPIGYVHVDGINWMRRKASIGALIGEVEYWGKGLATEVTKLIVDYCFGELNLNKIASLIYEPNKASQKCVERVGFTLEATIGDAGYSDGVYFPDLYYSYYRKDWDLKNQK